MEKSKNLTMLQQQLHHISGLRDLITAELEEAELKDPKSCNDENVLMEERVKLLKSRIEELDKVWGDVSNRVITAAAEVTDETKNEDNTKKTDYEEDKLIDKVEGLKWWLEKLQPQSANLLKEIILATIKKGTNTDNEDVQNSDKKNPDNDDKEKNSSKDGRSRSRKKSSGRGHQSRSRSNDRSPSHHRDEYDKNDKGRSSRQPRSSKRRQSRSRSNDRSPSHHRDGHDKHDKGRSSRQPRSSKRHQSRSRSNDRSPSHHRDGHDKHDKGRSSRQPRSSKRRQSRSRSNDRSPSHHRNGHDKHDKGRSSRQPRSSKRHQSRSRSNDRSPSHHRDGHDKNKKRGSPEQLPSVSDHRSRSRSNARYPVLYVPNNGYNVNPHNVQQYIPIAYPQQQFNRKLPFTNRPQGQGAWKDNKKRSKNSLARAAWYKTLKELIHNTETPSD